MLRTGTAAGRWVIAAAVLGSGVAFLDGSVVNTALPTIAKDLDTDLAGLQWVLNAYLLTLGSFLVVGGSLGDRFGRRKLFLIGLVSFGAASLVCGLAPTTVTLIATRAVQGVAAALLVPGSLAIISASFRPSDRGTAIGAWAGFGGVAGAIGPFLGGWLIESVSWRAVFFINLPLTAVAVVLTLRHVPESRDPNADHSIDVAGASALAIGLGCVVYALIEGPAKGWGATEVAIGVFGVIALVGFIVIELRTPHPMVPLGVFRSRQFSGANLVTFGVYGGLGATTFLVVVYLQTRLGYSPIAAGASLLPLTAMMLLFSARIGRARAADRPAAPDDGRAGDRGRGHGAVLVARAGRLVLEGCVPRGDGAWPSGSPSRSRHSPPRCSPRSRIATRACRRRSTTRSPGSGDCSRSRCCPRSRVSRSAGRASTSTAGSTPRCTSPAVSVPRAVWSRGSPSAPRYPCASAPAAISRFRASPSAWRSPRANRRQQTSYSLVC